MGNRAYEKNLDLEEVAKWNKFKANGKENIPSPNIFLKLWWKDRFLKEEVTVAPEMSVVWEPP